MHIRQNWQAKLCLDFIEHSKRFRKTHAALALQAGAVGLVKGRLVNKADIEPRAHFLQTRGHH
jgi:hypothetical protein